MVASELQGEVFPLVNDVNQFGSEVAGGQSGSVKGAEVGEAAEDRDVGEALDEIWAGPGVLVGLGVGGEGIEENAAELTVGLAGKGDLGDDCVDAGGGDRGYEEGGDAPVPGEVGEGGVGGEGGTEAAAAFDADPCAGIELVIEGVPQGANGGIGAGGTGVSGVWNGSDRLGGEVEVKVLSIIPGVRVGAWGKAQDTGGSGGVCVLPVG